MNLVRLLSITLKEKVKAPTYKGNINKYLKEMDKYEKSVKKYVQDSCNRTNVTKKVVIEAYNEMVQNAIDNNRDEPTPLTFTNFSKSEAKLRKNLQKQASSILSDFCAKEQKRENILVSLLTNENVPREMYQFISMGAKDEKELVRYALMLNDLEAIDPITKRKNVDIVSDFVNFKLKEIQNSIRNGIDFKDRQDFLNFAKENIDFAHIVSDLDPVKLNSFVNFGIKVDQNLKDDWVNNYAQQSMIFTNVKNITAMMANKLYTEMDMVEHCKATECFEEYANLMYDETREQFTKGDKNHDLSIFDEYRMAYDTLMSQDIVKARKQNPVLSEGEYNEEKLALNDTFKTITAARDLSQNFEDYTFMDQYGHVVEPENVEKAIIDGRAIDFKYQNNYAFTMALDSKNFARTLVNPNKGVKFNFKGTFDKFNKKSSDLFEQVSSSKDDKTKNELINKSKSLKSDCEKDLQSEIKKSMKELLKQVKKENPWYVKKKGNQSYTACQNKIDEFIGKKYKNLNEMKNDLNSCLLSANSYLNTRLTTSGAMKFDKHSVARRDAMKSVVNSLSDLDKQLEFANEGLNKVDLSNTFKKSKENILDKDNKKLVQFDEKVFDNTINKEKSHSIDKDIIIEINTNKDKDLISIEEPKITKYN